MGMNKQNKLILTESALEDLKIFKMYMEKNLFFIFLPICCFQKTAALCGFSQVFDYQQIGYIHSIIHLLLHGF